MKTPVQGGLTRRDFLKTFGGGIAVLCLSGGSAALATREVASTADQIASWLHIGEEGSITVYTGKVEVGQNIRTSLSQAVADELRVPISSIEMVMGDTGLTPYDRGTFGSRTTPEMAPQIRRAAASAREMLIDLAAEAWNTDRRALTIAGGRVVDGERSYGFGELTKGRRLVEAISADASPLPVGEWKVAGASVPKVNGEAFVTGRHTFVSDMKLPGMLIGKVLRPPSFGAKLVSLDSGAAAEDAVVVHEGDFVGVAAHDADTAARALRALQVRWTTRPQPSSEELFSYLKEHRSGTGGWGGRSNHEAGNVEQALASADERLKATYTVDYIAHAPMEPRAAVAEWKDGNLTLWTGTQRPFGVREELAEAFGIPEDRVRVIMLDTGSAYGGKHSGDAAIEAARLARAAGRPVKLVWTREEEFTWAYFRPAGVLEIESGIARDGTIAAWTFDNYNSGGSAIRTPYEVPNQRIAFHPSESPLRQGSYRGLAATANNFARESHMDDLAHAANIDPLAFRLKNLADPRLRAVLEAAADKFGWGRTTPTHGHGYGIACGVEKGGYVATCAEVSIDEGQVRIVRVVEAFECGAIVNPAHLTNQIEGSIIQGIGGALFESVAFENGTILNPRFSAYRVPRFSDTPEIEVVLVDRKDLPSAGAGETPIIGIAPAVGNAIYSATGVRLRSLPMAPNGVKV